MPGGVIESSGFDVSQRKYMFYFICIPLRLLLAYFVYTNSDSQLMKVLVALFSASAVYSNLMGLNSNNDVWWNRKFHLVTSTASLLLTIGGKMEYVTYIMVLDILYGTIHSVASHPWELK